MNAIDVIRRLHEHRDWVNRKLLDSAATLTDEALRRPLPIGQGSVWRSLVHLHAAEYVWLQALLGHEAALLPGDLADKLPGNQEAPGEFNRWSNCASDGASWKLAGRVTWGA